MKRHKIKTTQLILAHPQLTLVFWGEMGEITGVG